MGALKCWDMAMACWAGLVSAICWLARSKLRVGPRDLGEGLGLLVPRLNGTV